MGDSYTSGPGVPNSVSSSGLCSRSDHNYPSLVAAALKPTTFVDVSCAGATTDAFSSSFFGAAPQYDALNSDVRLVTVGIGGNDVGFGQIAVTCVIASITNSTGSPCKDNYTKGGTDQLRATFTKFGPKFAGVLQTIHGKAPNARVVVVGYPDILPDSKARCAPGIWTPIATGDVPYLNNTEKELNQVIADTAAANGATFVDTYSSSVGHDACQPRGVRWVEGLSDIQNGAPIHPNPLGHANDARQVLAALGAG